VFDKFKNIISEYPGYQSKKYLIAVSGGVDSMVLWDLMRKMHLNIAVAHCNFKLRGPDSDSDEQLVKETGLKYRTPVYVKHCPVSKPANVQLEARRLRYEWFEALRRKHGFDYILTAHHADDNLETFFINLFRGSGLRGLSGIPETDVIKRPLLAFTRNEILKYARANSILWREDVSNLSDVYLRNAIRHKLVPLMEEIKPGAAKGIRKSMELLGMALEVENAWFSDLKKRIVRKEKDTLAVRIKDLPPGSKRNLFLYKWLSAYGFTDFEAIEKIIAAQTGKYVASEGFRLFKQDNKLVLVPSENKLPEAVKFDEIPDTLTTPVSLKFEWMNRNKLSTDEIKSQEKNVAYIDAGLLEGPFEIRPWKPGERMQPIGMKGSKKISDILTGLKVPVYRKEKIYVFTSAGKPVWLIGLKIDDRFKISDRTGKVLKISLLKK
jgi:tRNA(Ile)-lysidine synthase